MPLNRAALTALCVCALALLAAVPGSADRPATRVDLGLEPRPPAPVCPENCRALARVTGFQVLTENGDGDRKNLPFRVPFNGTLTSWTIALSFPTNAQRAFFNKAWGSPATARIAVLRRIPKTSPPRYRLVRQTPPRSLAGWFGRTPRFPVRPPIPVRRGQIIALTVPTWAPAIAIDLPKLNRWRASRSPGRCLKPEHQRRSRPHQIRDSRRVYGCRYETARLLYSARIRRG